MADRQPFNADTHTLKASRDFQRGTLSKSKGDYLTRKEIRQLGPDGVAAIEGVLAERATWATAEGKPAKAADDKGGADKGGGSGSGGAS